MSITSRINEIETHLKEDYTNLEALGYDIPQDKNIENIASVLDNVWENQSHIEETGTTLSLNTNKGKAKVDLLGNTYQETTNGYQEFNANNIVATAIEVSNDGQTITMPIATSGNGIYGTATTLKVLCPNLKVGDIAYLYFTRVPSGYNNFIYLNNVALTWNNGTSQTITQEMLDSNLSLYGNRYTSGETSQVKLEDFIITKTQNASWEKFTYGASPNPSYPQPIQVVSGDNAINVCGKNLFDKDNSTFTSVLVSGSVTRWGYKLPKFNSNFYVSVTTSDSALHVYENIKGTLTNVITISTNPQLITNSSNDFYIINAGTSSQTNAKTAFDNNNIMVSYTNDRYEPYTRQTYQVNLPVENLFDKDNANVLIGYFAPSSDYKITSGSSHRTLYIPCKPNTTYTIRKSNTGGGLRFAVGTTTETPTIGGEAVSDFVQHNDYEHITFTTNSNANYLVIWYFNTSSTMTNEEMLATIQIEEGTKVNSYTPYGTNPLELCKIGTYQDKFIRNSGKNLFDGTQVKTTNTTNWGVTFENSVLTIQHKTAYSSGAPNIVLGTLPSGNYILSYKSVNKMSLYINGTYDQLIDDGETFVVEDGKTYAFYFSVADNSTVTFTNIILNFGDTALPYEPYGNGDWYLKKNIGKVVLNGSEEGWNYQSTQERFRLQWNVGAGNTYLGYCTHYVVDHNLTNDYTINIQSNYAFIRDSNYTSINNFKTWLSTYNTIVYYVLATPTYTKLTNTTLINQLEDVWRANTYDNQTNVSQINNDLPFELFFKALGTPSNVSLLSMNRPSLQINQIEEEPIEEIEESGDLDGENQENI